MADEPTLSAAGFLNHVRRTLDASLQRWEFADVYHSGDYHEAKILFLGTGRTSFICNNDGEWIAEDGGKANDWLESRLRGQVRDEAGNPCVP